MSSGTKIESNTYLPKGLKCTRIRKMRIFLQEKPRAGSEGAARRFRRSAGGWRGIIESRTARDRSFFPRGRFLRDIWTSKDPKMVEFIGFVSFFFSFFYLRSQTPPKRYHFWAYFNICCGSIRKTPQAIWRGTRRKRWSTERPCWRIEKTLPSCCVRLAFR